MADKLAYKLLISSTDELLDISEFMMDADIRQRTNNVPSGRFTLMDKHKVFENAVEPTRTYNIIFSASLDGGGHWSRRFGGLVEAFNITVDATGARNVEVECYGGPGLRYSYMSPNQVAIGEYETFSMLFTGTETATDGTPWNKDSRGNYPNGLLYDTGYSYSGVTDYFTDALDVPTRVGYGARKKLDAIRSYLEPFGAEFYLVDSGSVPLLVVRKNPLLEDFTPVHATYTIGKDINSYNRSIEVRSTRELLTLVGSDPSIWTQMGSGTFEEFLHDSDVYDVTSAVANAKLLFSISQEPKESAAIKIAPWTGTPFIGGSIAIRDIDGSLITRSVVGVSDEFKPDRWTTEITLERPSLDTVNTIAEIMQSFSVMENEDMRNSVFIRLTMGATSFYPASPCINILAYGVGTGTRSTPTDSSTLDEPIFFRGLTNYYDESATFIRGESPPINPLVWAELNSSQGNALIREIGLYANDLTGGSAYLVTESFAWDRKTSEWGDTGRVEIGTLEDGRYLLTLEDIRLESTYGVGYSVYPIYAKEARGFWMDSTSAPSTPLPIPTESSDWNNTTISTEIGADEKARMSRDLTMTSPAFDCFTASGEINLSLFVTPASLLRFKVPFKFNSTSAKPLVDRYVEDIKIIAIYRGSATIEDSPANSLCSMTVCSISDDLATRVWVENAGTNWSVLSNNMEVRTVSFKTEYPSIPLSRWVDENGYINVAWFNKQNDTSYGRYSHMIGYASVVWDLKPLPSSSHGLNTVFEFVRFVKNNGTFFFTLPPKNIIGVWLSASTTDFGYVPIGTDLSTFFEPDDLTLADNSYVWEIVDVEKFPPTRIELVKVINADDIGPDIAKGYSSDALLLNATVLDDTSAIRAIVEQNGAWIAYETRASWELNSPPKYSTDLMTLSFVPEDGGKSSLASMSMWGAPPYGCNIAFVYRCVATDSTNGGCIGRVLLTNSGAMTLSSIREGFDKNDFRSAYFMFDWMSSSAYNVAYAGGGGSYRYI